MAIEARPDGSKLTQFFQLPAFQRISPVTLELLDTTSVSSRVQSPLPPGWQGLLDLKKGRASHTHNQDCIMKRKEKHERMKPKLELKLNLLLPNDSGGNNNSFFSLPSPSSDLFSAAPSGTSPASSCISSELNAENRTRPEGNQNQTPGWCGSPEATSMVLAGCRRCLMYVMLSHADPKCPRCKSTCLLDFQQKHH